MMSPSYTFVSRFKFNAPVKNLALTLPAKPTDTTKSRSLTQYGNAEFQESSITNTVIISFHSHQLHLF